MVDVGNYYRFKGNHYVCPTCLVAHKHFDDFVAAHRHHAGQFMQSKAETFNLCTIIKTENDEEEEEEVKEEEVVDELTSDVDEKEKEEVVVESEFYIWNNMEDARNYYKHYKQFLCPQCSTHTANFDDFVEQHRHHAKAFLRPKSTYSKPPRQTTTPSINIPLQQQLSPQWYPTKAMKRQYGGALEQIHVSHRSSLRQCHTTIEATLLDHDVTSVREFVRAHRDRLMLEFHHRLQGDIDYKVQMSLLCNYHRVIKKADEDDVQENKEWFVSNVATPFNRTSDFMKDGAQRLDEKLANYASHGSNWTIRNIIKVGFVFTRYDDMCRVAGHSYIPTPASLVNGKNGIVNPKNKRDHLCFLYAILAVVKYDEIDDHHSRISNYVGYLDELKYDEASMPMRVSNIPKFERHNPQYRINVMQRKGMSTATTTTTAMMMRMMRFSKILIWI